MCTRCVPGSLSMCGMWMTRMLGRPGSKASGNIKHVEVDGVVTTRFLALMGDVGDAPRPLQQPDVVNSDWLQSDHAPTEDIVVSAVLLRRVRRRVLCIGTTLGEDGRSSVAPSIETV